jgi:hypothetical protein
MPVELRPYRCKDNTVLINFGGLKTRLKFVHETWEHPGGMVLVCLSGLLDFHVYVVLIVLADFAGLAVGLEVIVNVPLLVERAMKGFDRTLVMTVIGRGSRHGYNRESYYDR